MVAQKRAHRLLYDLKALVGRSPSEAVSDEAPFRLHALNAIWSLASTVRAGGRTMARLSVCPARAW